MFLSFPAAVTAPVAPDWVSSKLRRPRAAVQFGEALGTPMKPAPAPTSRGPTPKVNVTPPQAPFSSVSREARRPFPPVPTHLLVPPSRTTTRTEDISAPRPLGRTPVRQPSTDRLTPLREQPAFSTRPVVFPQHSELGFETSTPRKPVTSTPRTDHSASKQLRHRSFSLASLSPSLPKHRRGRSEGSAAVLARLEGDVSLSGDSVTSQDISSSSAADIDNSFMGRSFSVRSFGGTFGRTTRRRLARSSLRDMSFSREESVEKTCTDIDLIAAMARNFVESTSPRRGDRGDEPISEEGTDLPEEYLASTVPSGDEIGQEDSDDLYDDSSYSSSLSDAVPAFVSTSFMDDGVVTSAAFPEVNHASRARRVTVHRAQFIYVERTPVLQPSPLEDSSDNQTKRPDSDDEEVKTEKRDTLSVPDWLEPAIRLHSTPRPPSKTMSMNDDKENTPVTSFLGLPESPFPLTLPSSPTPKRWSTGAELQLQQKQPTKAPLRSSWIA